MKPELIIMYTWDINGFYDNKVCGHMYEVIDYFWKLKDYFQTKIIMPTNYNIDKILLKYNFTNNEKNIIKDACISRPKNGIIKTKKGRGIILVTDGNVGNFKGLLYGKVVQFACGKMGLDGDNLKNINWYLLDDQRFLEQAGNYNIINKPKLRFDYNKKILLDRIKFQTNISTCIKYYGLLYLTENCRKINKNEFSRLINKYCINDKRLIILSDYLDNQNTLNYDIINIRENPIDPFNIDFESYIYTKLDRKWDCSSRFIPECIYNNKKVILEIDYIDEALNIRLDDSKNMDKINLSNDTKIIKILMEIYND